MRVLMNIYHRVAEFLEHLLINLTTDRQYRAVSNNVLTKAASYCQMWQNLATSLIYNTFFKKNAQAPGTFAD